MATSSTCTFTNTRDEQLSARLERPDGPVHATAVFAHCFTCSKDLRAARRLARALADRGIAVLSFDFTGLGSSEGDFAASTFSSDVDDLVAAAEYLAQTVAPPRLLVGHSLGGAAVLTAAGRLDTVEAVATIGAPADVGHLNHLLTDDDVESIREQGEAEVTLAGRSFSIRSEFLDDLGQHRLTDLLAELDAALLFLHAPLDETVGVDNARILFEAARHPKSFVSLADADHLLTDGADARYAADVIGAWATRYLADVPLGPESAERTAPAPMPRGSGTYGDDVAVARTTSGPDARVTTRGFLLQADEPASAGGTETGPTPYDYLGAALAACTSMTVRMYADRADLRLEEVTTEVAFDRLHARDCEECEHSEGRIQRFTRTVTLQGDLDDEARARLLSIADRCPVHRTLEGQIEIRTRAGEA